MPISLDAVYPWGRTLEEYRDIFLLDDNDLSGTILGCADGPASFNYEATQLGTKVISCDPLYTYSYLDIERRVYEANEYITKQVTENSSHYNWEYLFKNHKDLSQKRLKTMGCFLEDFKLNYQHQRYISAELPHPPFKSGYFELALVSHFLFLYDDVLSYQFHLDAILELCRVAKEVRIFPIVSNFDKNSTHLNSLMTELSSKGFITKIKTSNYKFISSSSDFLVIKNRNKN